jgi:hypothetical protein
MGRRARGAKRKGSPTGTPTRGHALHTEPQTKDITPLPYGSWAGGIEHVDIDTFGLW